MRQETQQERLMRAVMDGCNTTGDLSEETGFSINACSHFVARSVRAGLLRHTGRKIASRDGSNSSSFKVFEPVAWSVAA